MDESKQEKISEVDLCPPVSRYLTSLGYTVRSEVKNCDITAVREDELLVVELKRSFTIHLLNQAVKRQRVADSVYVAIPAPKGGKFSRAWRDMCHLLKRLELGLIIVHFPRSGSGDAEPSVEVVFHPDVLEARKNRKLRRAIIREIGGRTGDYNTGGSSGVGLVTAYRETAIHVACCLAEYGPMTPARIKELGAGPKAQAILARNHYGWFERVDRGVYRLHEKGISALAEYDSLRSMYTERIREKAREDGDASAEG